MKEVMKKLEGIEELIESFLEDDNICLFFETENPDNFHGNMKDLCKLVCSLDEQLIKIKVFLNNMEEEGN